MPIIRNCVTCGIGTYDASGSYCKACGKFQCLGCQKECREGMATMNKEKCKKHQWVTTKVSITQDDNYHPPRPVEVPVERICSVCSLINCNFGEDTWDEGRLYNTNGFWDNIKEIHSFDDVINLVPPWKAKEVRSSKKVKTSYEVKYCSGCGRDYGSHYFRFNICRKCGFELKKIKVKKKGIGVKKQRKGENISKRRRGRGFATGSAVGCVTNIVPFAIIYFITGNEMIALLGDMFWIIILGLIGYSVGIKK